MELLEEILPGVHRIRLKSIQDSRGDFVKTYGVTPFSAAGIDFTMREEYYSISRKDVIRGMHFQTPPHDHVKVVYCAAGAVEDVLLDLRSGPGYGRACSLLLSADRPELVVIPPGIAHGFRSLKDDSLMVYKTNTEYAPQYDKGILWNSFGFHWAIESPITSDRDGKFPPLEAFASPF